MGALGIVFADGKNSHLEELVRVRTEASIPFGSRFRLIDFTLSSLVNADIIQVAIITKRNYQSLMDHIGSGKEWDLSRKNGGVVIFPPFGSYQSERVYANTIEALSGIVGFIKKSAEDNVILTSCDSVSIIDYAKALRKHEKNNADITIIYKELDNNRLDRLVINTDDESNVINAQFGRIGSNLKTDIGTYIIKKDLLINLLEIATSKGATSFEQEIIVNNINKYKILGFYHDDLYLPIDSMETYYKNNMLLLDEDVKKEVLESIPLFTKAKDSAPTKYKESSKVKNSLIADGCIIEGIVENSILFRGVKVSKGAIVKDCILMQDSNIGENVKITAVITDKNVKINKNQELAGCAKLPYYIGKSMII